MLWTDIEDIAEALYETHEDVDPTTARFTDLRLWVLDLDGFTDTPDHCNERILEAIQGAWIELV